MATADARKRDPQSFHEGLDVSRSGCMELCFVKYCKVLGEDDLSIDQVDSALNCI